MNELKNKDLTFIVDDVEYVLTAEEYVLKDDGDLFI